MTILKHVQFADSTKLVIVSVFCGEQDPEAIKFLGEVEDMDQRYLDFMAKLQFTVN
jgi:hypothetical protein